MSKPCSERFVGLSVGHGSRRYRNTDAKARIRIRDRRSKDMKVEVPSVIFEPAERTGVFEIRFQQGRSRRGEIDGVAGVMFVVAQRTFARASLRGLDKGC